MSAMTAGASAQVFLSALGFTPRAIQGAAKGDLESEVDLSPSRFLRICASLGRSKGNPDAEAWARLTPSTWQGTIVRCAYDPEEAFAPDENTYEDEEAKDIARRGTFVCSAAGTALFAVDAAEGTRLYELQEEAPPVALGTFVEWLHEGAALARGA